MSVTIKTQHEIELMREAGHLLEKVHDGLIPYIKPGVSTKEIDKIGEEMIRSMGCIPNFLNYGGFPASFCISLNDEVVHGIPSEEKIIQDGDLVKIDAGKIIIISDPVCVSAQDPHAGGMKGSHPDTVRAYSNKIFYPLLHFSGCLVGKGDRHNIPGIYSKLIDQICNSVCQDSCFPRPGSCQQKHGAIRGKNAFLLLFI